MTRSILLSANKAVQKWKANPASHFRTATTAAAVIRFEGFIGLRSV